jgi:hypothetical protein
MKTNFHVSFNKLASTKLGIHVLITQMLPKFATGSVFWFPFIFVFMQGITLIF